MDVKEKGVGGPTANQYDGVNQHVLQVHCNGGDCTVGVCVDIVFGEAQFVFADVSEGGFDEFTDFLACKWSTLPLQYMILTYQSVYHFGIVVTWCTVQSQ